MADLKESIIAVTCGSPQIVAGFGAGTVVPGKGVVPGRGVAGVPMNKVEVGRARKVGVAGTGVAGDPHAVRMTASRIHPMRTTGSVFAFIINSCFDYYQHFTKTESFSGFS
jgi:hypothetical protein